MDEEHNRVLFGEFLSIEALDRALTEIVAVFFFFFPSDIVSLHHLFPHLLKETCDLLQYPSHFLTGVAKLAL